MNAPARYADLHRRSLAERDAYWAEQARLIDWQTPPRRICNHDNPPFTRWFEGGTTNLCHNAVDRHAAVRGSQNALIWVSTEVGQEKVYSFSELQAEVQTMAAILQAQGVKQGDRVLIYMPMIPEAVFAMLACTRIGAVHSVVFGGFASVSLATRIEDAESVLVVSADAGSRGGKVVPYKPLLDEALRLSAHKVPKVLMVDRGLAPMERSAGRDLDYAAERARHAGAQVPVVWLDSTAISYTIYTSGTTGRPKGVQRDTGGYAVALAASMEQIFMGRPGETYFSTSDIGWVVGHSYIVYGPLCNGATTVLFESTPLHPDAGRYWQVIDDVQANIFYTAPTALRALLRVGDEPVKKHARTSLRVLGSVGEPINPEVWQWYHDVVGDRRCAVVDTWWQTETGGILISALPGATPCKPGSATFPLPGVRPLLVDDQGKELVGNGVAGNLCLAGSWPGQARTILNDHARFRQTYFAMYPGLYFTGDGCRRDEDGYYWITGRVDDVLNVAGHRLGTAEIESALVSHEFCAEAAVVGFPHDLKGQGIYAYVIAGKPAEGVPATEVEAVLKQVVRKVISPIATPDRIQVVPGLPKTRSGKIMRRILRKVAEANYTELGDLSTLAEPQVVEQIVQGHKAGR
ncbi:MAG: acetate--CoA ligase [Planctomycetota bacterium]